MRSRAEFFLERLLLDRTKEWLSNRYLKNENTHETIDN